MRSLIAVLSLICVFGASQIKAQTSSFYVGAKAGGSASEFRFTEDLKELYPTSNKLWGINGGFDMGIKLDNWTISTGVHYAQKGGEYQTDNFDAEGTTAYFTGREKLHFISVPVLLGYRQNLADKVGWSIAIGPSFNFGLAGNIDETTEYFNSDQVDFQNYKVNFGSGVNDDYKSTQVGFQISPGLFVELNEKSKVHFNVTWDFGTGDMFSERYKAANDFFDYYKGNQIHRNTMFSIGYEYHFNFEDKY
jgi:outer membrane protein with beta-barrel domain